jgi:hypothetical protein
MLGGPEALSARGCVAEVITGTISNSTRSLQRAVHSLEFVAHVDCVNLRAGSGLPRWRDAGNRNRGRHDPPRAVAQVSALADSRADARELRLPSVVTVNGDPEVRRGRQLHRGDVVAVGEQTVRVV